MLKNMLIVIIAFPFIVCASVVGQVAPPASPKNLILQSTNPPGPIGPTAPAILAPADGSNGVSTSQALTWNASSGATSYDVYFGSGNPPGLAMTTGSTSYSPPLSNSTTYYWKVCAKNSAGQGCTSVKSYTTDVPSQGFSAIPIAFYARTPWVSVQGPAMQSLGNINFAAQGPAGEIYFTRGEVGHDGASPGVWVLDNGKISCLLCNEAKGFRDGPAAMALFDPRGQGGYSGEMDVSVDKTTGAIYLADGWNRRIRKLAKDVDGNWMVSTFAGGGGTVMQPGKDYTATAIDLNVYVALTVDSSGNVWTATQGQLIKITRSGTARIMAADYSILSDVVDMDSDSAGNIYMVVRGTLDCIVKYSTDGVLSQLTRTDRNNPTWDGPVATANFNCPSFIGVAPDGSAIYVGGGDENTIRRVKDEGSGLRVSTLQQDGTWIERIEYNTYYNESGGWKLGSPRFVDSNGDLYIAFGYRFDRPFSKLTPVNR